MPLEPLDDVRRLILGAVSRLDTLLVSLESAYGHVLAEDITAPEDVPPFANTAMDGFAVRAADTEGAGSAGAGSGGEGSGGEGGAGPLSLNVVGTLAAGHSTNREVGPGEAMRIMTGAPLPAGADAVVMVENTSPADDPDRVLIHAPARQGDHVRLPGSDIHKGDTVFTEGTVVSPAHIGSLASLGVVDVKVWRKPVVGVISTGDELVESGPLLPGQIRDSNRRTLIATLKADGFTGLDLGIVRDDEDAVTEALTYAIARCDAVITTGGVSVGDFDYVKVVLDRMAAATGGWMRSLGVAIRPAKPLAFGMIGRAAGAPAPVFGLPGNTVSSLVSYELFARPGLRKLAGFEHPVREPVFAVAAQDFSRRPDGKLHLVRCVGTFDADGRLHVRSAGGQSSHQLATMATANCLALVPDGTGIAAGDAIEALLLSLP